MISITITRQAKTELVQSIRIEGHAGEGAPAKWCHGVSAITNVLAELLDVPRPTDGLTDLKVPVEYSGSAYVHFAITGYKQAARLAPRHVKVTFK